MKTVSFINRGLIDIRAVRTFGMSAKDCENPIGFFGTGLKYAIAICLRLGCKVTMFVGQERYEFSTAKVSMRGAEFGVVTMNGEEMGFTTDLGKTWEPWQAFRELYCNTIDEGGSVQSGDVEPADEHTAFVVDGEPIYSAFQDRHKIVLASEPRWTYGNVRVYAQQSEYGYYRGIRALRLKDPSVLTYNVTSKLDLTEDRTVKDPFNFLTQLRYAVLDSTDEEFITKFVCAPQGSLEQQIDLDGWYTPGETFLRVIEKLAFRDISNLSAHRVYKKHRKIELSPDPSPLNPVEKKQLERATKFCQGMGFSVADYEVIVTADLAEKVLGQAYEGRIYISRLAFTLGTKVVAGTLIEEFIHLRHKLDDESRGLQDFLLNALVSMGELAIGEPV